MATAAVRTQKRELEPHWRDALHASLKRLALRAWGALLLAVAAGGAIALATYNTTDPSFSTAAGGPPTNWMGGFGAYSSDVLLLLFGLGSVLFVPVIGLAGLRMMRLEPAGRIGRALFVAGVGAILIGIALSLTSGSSVSGLPGGWGGAIGLAAAHGVDGAIGLIPDDAVAGPVRLAALILFALAGLVLGYFALALQQEGDFQDHAELGDLALRYFDTLIFHPRSGDARNGLRGARNTLADRVVETFGAAGDDLDDFRD